LFPQAIQNIATPRLHNREAKQYTDRYEQETYSPCHAENRLVLVMQILHL
jgi:hypothetical protein